MKFKQNLKKRLSLRQQELNLRPLKNITIWKIYLRISCSLRIQVVPHTKFHLENLHGKSLGIHVRFRLSFCNKYLSQYCTKILLWLKDHQVVRKSRKIEAPDFFTQKYNCIVSIQYFGKYLSLSQDWKGVHQLSLSIDKGLVGWHSSQWYETGS